MMEAVINFEEALADATPYATEDHSQSRNCRMDKNNHTAEMRLKPMFYLMVCLLVSPYVSNCARNLVNLLNKGLCCCSCLFFKHCCVLVGYSVVCN